MVGWHLQRGDWILTHAHRNIYFITYHDLHVTAGILAFVCHAWTCACIYIYIYHYSLYIYMCLWDPPQTDSTTAKCAIQMLHGALYKMGVAQHNAAQDEASQAATGSPRIFEASTNQAQNHLSDLSWAHRLEPVQWSWTSFEQIIGTVARMTHAFPTAQSHTSSLRRAC